MPSPHFKTYQENNQSALLWLNAERPLLGSPIVQLLPSEIRLNVADIPLSYSTNLVTSGESERRNEQKKNQ